MRGAEGEKKHRKKVGLVRESRKGEGDFRKRGTLKRLPESSKSGEK